MILAGAAGDGFQTVIFRPKNFLPTDSMGPPAKAQHAIRRSTRLPLEVPVLVTSLDTGVPFSEKCNTTLVNAHGCGLIVSRVIAQGIQVRLEIVSAKRHTTARVAEVVPLGGDPETWLVGLELEVPGNFWGIEYAPSDWKIDDWKIGENSSPAAEQPSATPEQNAASKLARSRRWHLTDISPGACYLETATPFPVETPVVLSIRASNTECLLEGVVRVSHAQTGMGIEFAGGPAQDLRARVEELIGRLISNREAPRIFVGRKEGQHPASIPASHVADVAPDTSVADPLLELVRDGASLSSEQFLNDLQAQRLGKRRDPRIDLALPVLLSGTDISGRPLDQRVITVNISRRGALLDGIHGRLGLGDTISLSRLQKKEQFRVAWVGVEGTPAAGQIGVAAVDPNTTFWAEVLEATAHSGLEAASLRCSDGGTGPQRE
jgi:hypothetical protein